MRTRKRSLEEKTCAQCAALFMGRYPTKYCGPACAEVYIRAQGPLYNLRARRKARNTNPMKYLLYRVKNRAKTQGIYFDLSEDDLSLPTHCPVLGIELIWNLGIGRKGYHPNSFSVDRIRSELGYIAGNVRVISARANLLKNNATIEELSLVLEDLKQLLMEKTS